MYPFLQVAGQNLPTYALMALAGTLIAGAYAEHQAVKQGVHSFYMIEVMLVSVMGVVIGGHLLYALVHIQEWDQGPAAVLGGQVFYGGLFGGLLTGAVFIRRKGYPKQPYYDIAACSIPLFHGFARIGCFLSGCCYGIESSLGFTFTHSLVPGANGVSRFPVQLLEASLCLLLFAGLHAIRKKAKGHLLSIYLGTYAVIRMGTEMLRGDDALRGLWLNLSTSQMISLVVLAVLLIRFMFFRRTADAAKAAKG